MSQPFIGEIRIFAGNFAPAGWAFCDGSLVPISENDTLFNLIGTTYGGDGQSTFGLPNLNGRTAIHMGRGTSGTNYNIGETAGIDTVTLSLNQTPVHTHVPLGYSGTGNASSPSNTVFAASSVNEFATGTAAVSLAAPTAAAGGNQPHENLQPLLVVNFIISLFGIYPTPSSGGSTPLMGQLALYSFNFAPQGWAQCNGQLLPINQNQALFSLLGTAYGGDGRVNFGLPDLRGRVPIGVGQGYTQGTRGGEENHTLIISELPAHSHGLTGTTVNTNLVSPSNALPAPSPSNPFSTGNPDVAMEPTMIGTAGGSQAHSNQSPYAVLCYCIALQGAFPSSN